MKIAFMLGEFPCLSETFVLNQITSLLKRGHSISIFAERGSTTTERHPDVDRFGLQPLTRYEHMPRRFGARALRLPTIFEASRPFVRSLDVRRYGGWAASFRLAWASHMVAGAPEFDIIQCHFGALGLKAVLLRDTGALSGKIVTAFHGEDITNYPRRFRGNHYAPLFASGDLFLPISLRWNRALIAMGCPPDRIRQHSMGVDTSQFAQRSGTRLTTPLRIISIARLVEKKGIADALHAVALLEQDVHYVIVGDGPLRAELEELAQTLGIAARVAFRGAQPRQQVAEELRSADVLLAPSVTGGDGDIEGVPVSIMEAMACGIPVVSTRHSAIPELVHDGTTGFLVDEHDVDGASDRLGRLLADAAMRARMGAAGHDVIMRDFNIETLTDRLEQHYRDLLMLPPRACAHRSTRVRA